MALSLPLEEILEDLELPRAEAGIGYLERLFLRFVERVPFETASKIRRNARESEPAKRPRTPDVFWAERLAEGAGGTCFARVAAFHALIEELGFSSRLAIGRVLKDGDHAALLVRLGEGEWICDVGFPLPALLPARPGRVETGMGPVEVARTDRGWQARLEEGVPDGPRRLEIFDAPVEPAEFRSHWEATFRPDSKFLTSVTLRKQLESRAVSFARGELRIDDRHSRARIPLAPPRAGAIEDAFGISSELVEEAFSLAGDPAPASPNAEVAVYLESAAGVEEAWSSIATPERYVGLYEGVASATAESAGPRSWRVTLGLAGESAAPAPAPTIVEHVRADDALHTVTVARESPASSTSWSVEERDGAVYLVRRAELAGPRLDLLRNDSLRGRIAGTLAVDLLGWARSVR